ncbi:hypothetical protein [Nitrincola sp. MINF-07-Sa-05]|uniref:hypothetical protein n=1 Tax=Nitrincola salilacus TaxID=3400273 RepID=UPI0039184A8A
MVRLVSTYDGSQGGDEIWTFLAKNTVKYFFSYFGLNRYAFSKLDSGNASLPELIIESSGYKLVQDHTGAVISAAVEGRALSALIQDFKRSGNLLGNYRITQGNGRYYVVFKGNQKLRSLIKGTRYLTDNPLVISLGIASPSEMLKGAARSNIFITLIISGGGNSIKWIFLEEYLWTNFLSDISIDLLKGGLSILAGVAAAYFTAKSMPRVIISRLVGLAVGIGTGVGLNQIENDQIEKSAVSMAQEIAFTYLTAYDAMSNPIGFVSEKGEQAKDLMICSVSNTGDWAINKAENIIRDNVNRILRQFLNPPRRLY